EQAVRRGGGPGTYDRDLYELGVQRFDAIKGVNRQITQRLQDEVASARAMAQDRLDSTVTQTSATPGPSTATPDAGTTRFDDQGHEA
ncbi:hypothetical protein, partial [Escherichia coli]|uniref:hypothetical protein n=1 Tax=Escherichia coli TaxID=562 RepID=UPI003D09377B